MPIVRRLALGCAMGVLLGTSPAFAATGRGAAGPGAPSPGRAADRPTPSARPTAAPTPAPEATLSPEELLEIQKALGGSPAPGGAVSPPLPAATPDPLLAQLGPLGPQFRNNQTMNPNISVITDVAAAAFSQPNPLQAGNHDPNRTGFNLQQVELSTQSAVDPFFTFQSNIVFAQFGVEVEEAYGTTTSLPFDLQARAGQFLTRFGRINATHPHSWEFADQPFVIGKFMGAEGNRGLGAELSWLAPLPWYAEWVGSLTDAAGASGARSFYGATDLGVRRVQDLQATTALQQFFPLSRDLSLNWGLSAATGPNPTGRDNRTDLFGTDVYLKWRPLEGGSWTTVSFTGEALARRRQGPGALLTDHGGYGTLFWKFAQQWGTAVRYDFGSGLANDPLDPDWTSDRHRYSADLTYWPTEFSRLRWQASMDRPGWRPEPIYATFLTLEFVTGAHGSHKF